MTATQKTNGKNRTRLSAKTADRFELYLESVQDPTSDLHFVRRVFGRRRGREPLTMREDFCGTAAFCAEWAGSSAERRAVGLDLHQPTLDYGQLRHVAPLGPAAERVELVNGDVLDGTTESFDVIVAFNFSYSVFKERSELLRYFKRARRNVKKDGAFFIDLYGGPDAQIAVVETTRMQGFTYVWDQRPLDAVTGWGKRYIHFRFPDGTEMKRAFTYDWRLWTLPELRELLLEAGFKSCDVYWEGTDDEGEGNGIFRRVRGAENDASWIAYVVAWP